jgi:ABC-type branched-subunit amino acid transport system substrate-binding protein
MTRLRVGACLSLTGRYGRFGRQAANGLEAWRALAADGVDLLIEDDRSDPEQLATVFARVAARCDLLLGPYSTHLTRKAGQLMAEVDGLLWNHGGSGDDVQTMFPGRIVSVPTPTTRYAEPFVRARAADGNRAPLWIVAGPGRFARQVAAGALHQAHRYGLQAVEMRADEAAVSFEQAPDLWDLFSVGTFEDDAAVVRKARSAPRPPRAACSVAAGVHDFASVVERPDGVYGVAQWFPGRRDRPDVGPDEGDFIMAYRHVAGSPPDYPAVQAAATAALAVRCAEAGGSIERHALWRIVTAFRTTTLLGVFEVDRRTGAQLGHASVLLRWRGDELRLVA